MNNELIFFINIKRSAPLLALLLLTSKFVSEITMSEKNVHEIEKFYGCYLLVSLNKDQKYKAGTYIGFTG